MNDRDKYDVAIVGGGLAGLAAAILLAGRRHRVVLFEKEQYPFHKVCGEYISMESYDLLMSLGLPLDEMNLPRITNLVLSAPSGNALSQRLPLGGLGISRYTIDAKLASIAEAAGVHVMQATRVTDVEYTGDEFRITSDKGVVGSRIVFGTFGKRSNLDMKLKRSFVSRRPNALNNYIAVKYHALLDHPPGTIALHNFENGYCGISPVEEGRVCICYLTTAHNLKSHGNQIRQMEEEVLFENPHIRAAFRNAQMLYEKPLTISQISFEKKELMADHILMIGDTASLIAPLCGNGMSMALHAAGTASRLTMQYLEGGMSREALEHAYAIAWRNMFSRRLRAGRIIQSLFGKKWITNSAVGILRHFPGVLTSIIRQTHG